MQGRGLDLPRGWGTICNNRNIEGLTEKVASELRLEGGKAVSLVVQKRHIIVKAEGAKG